MQVSEDGVLLLVEEAHAVDDLDAADLEEKLRRAEDAIAEAEEGSEALRRAETDKRRWAAFLAVAKGDGPAAASEAPRAPGRPAPGRVPRGARRPPRRSAARPRR